MLFCDFAQKALRIHWETKQFQNAFLTFHFLNFLNGKTSFSASRESRPENIVKHNRNEVLFCSFIQKALQFHWKTKWIQNTILISHFVDFSNGKTSFPASRKSRSENVVNHNENDDLFSYFTRKVLRFHWKTKEFQNWNPKCAKPFVFMWF